MLSDEAVLKKYYDLRAREYERIYEDQAPGRQSELERIAALIGETYAGRDVLEIACGTGYWTRELARVARSVHAIDASPASIEVAHEKELDPAKVKFMIADAYDLFSVAGAFDAALAGMWISHVPKARLHEFLVGLHQRLAAGARVIMFDNVWKQDSGGVWIDNADGKDTYRVRKLDDGSEHRVIKNYYDVGGLEDLFGPYTQEIEIDAGRHYWWVRYRL